MSAWTRWAESRARKLIHGARVSRRLVDAAVLRSSLGRPRGRDPGGRPSPDSILVLGTGYIGDLVLATPTLQGLRRGFPSARITVVVEDQVEELFAESPVQDRLLPIATARREDLLALARRLRGEGPDVVVVLPHTVDGALFAFATGAPIRVGHASQGRRFLLTRTGGNRKAVHEVERQLDLVRALGLQAAEPDPPRVWPLAEAAGSAARLLADLAEGEGPVVALPLGATNPARRWSPANYAAVVRRLAEERGARFLLLGAPSDRPGAEEILGGTREGVIPGEREAPYHEDGGGRVGPGDGAGRAPGRGAPTRDLDRVLDLTGRTTLAEVAWLLDRVDLTIGSDSGLLHVAAARGCPVVGLYGPGDPVAWGPFGPGHAVVRVPMMCSPCANHVCRSVACIRTLPVEPVVDAALALLDRGGRIGASPRRDLDAGAGGT